MCGCPVYTGATTEHKKLQFIAKDEDESNEEIDVIQKKRNRQIAKGNESDTNDYQIRLIPNKYNPDGYDIETIVLEENVLNENIKQDNIFPLKPITKLPTQLIPEMLERRCKRLLGESRTAIEETGSNILYLAMGFLEWYEDENSSESPTYT